MKTLSGPGEYQLLNYAEPKDVLVKVVKRTESYGSFFTLNGLSHDGRIEGVWGNKPHIVFIGDSITTGYGVESDKLNCSMGEIIDTSNGRLSYASLAAAELGATKSLVAYSGGGLSRNWKGYIPEHDVPDFFVKSWCCLPG